MKIKVKLQGERPCIECEALTQLRIWDTDDPSYSLPICRYHIDKWLPKKVTFMDLIKVFNLVEWLILLLIAAIIARVIWAIFG